MKSRSAWLAALAVVTVAGCSSASPDDPAPRSPDEVATATTRSTDDGRDGIEGTASSTRGAIELAVSRTCSPGPDCVLVNGEHVVVDPSQFVRAGVEDAVAQGNTAINLRFDDEGTAVLASSSSEVAEAGPDGRLVMKIGDRVVSAVRVPTAVEGSEVQVALPADVSADAVVDLVRAG